MCIAELHRWLVQCFVVVVQLLSHVWLFVTPRTADAKRLLPPPSPRVCPNSCLLSWWCYLTILSSAAPFSFCLQSFPAWRSFPMSQLFASGHKRIMGIKECHLPYFLSHKISYTFIYSSEFTLKKDERNEHLPISFVYFWLKRKPPPQQLEVDNHKTTDKMWSTGEGNGKPLQYSCLENPMNRQKDMTLKDELPRLVGAQYTTGEEWRNDSRKNEEMEPKQKQCPVVDVTGDGSKVRCCKEQYCIRIWIVRSINEGKLEVIKQEITRVNIDILGISELKWTGMGKFYSDDHYIYYYRLRIP